ncbi:uncharacterized protein KY384_000804 [Bacidia gigantensis]|uniref:uncharacterized protein n=1 Tax=Bacidia gigantensis TaxID=2732470 RepID=UPI001D04824C|nr:uncharacterized protein KY384_000804 [Bacidia gigantensis]KAG8526042.1 hypothetical protein KY384_000804 [Bacidia gigantensis]
METHTNREHFKDARATLVQEFWADSGVDTKRMKVDFKESVNNRKVRYVKELDPLQAQAEELEQQVKKYSIFKKVLSSDVRKEYEDTQRKLDEVKRSIKGVQAQIEDYFDSEGNELCHGQKYFRQAIISKRTELPKLDKPMEEAKALMKRLRAKDPELNGPYFFQQPWETAELAWVKLRDERNTMRKELEMDEFKLRFRYKEAFNEKTEEFEWKEHSEQELADIEEKGHGHCGCQDYFQRREHGFKRQTYKYLIPYCPGTKTRREYEMMFCREYGEHFNFKTRRFEPLPSKDKPLPSKDKPVSSTSKALDSKNEVVDSKNEVVDLKNEVVDSKNEPQPTYDSATSYSALGVCEACMMNTNIDRPPCHLCAK